MLGVVVDRMGEAYAAIADVMNTYFRDSAREGALPETTDIPPSDSSGKASLHQRYG